MAKLKVTHHDNRGGKEALYGFVYFNDDTRVGYAIGIPETRETDGLFSSDWGGQYSGTLREGTQLLEGEGNSIMRAKAQTTFNIEITGKEAHCLDLMLGTFTSGQIEKLAKETSTDLEELHTVLDDFIEILKLHRIR